MRDLAIERLNANLISEKEYHWQENLVGLDFEMEANQKGFVTKIRTLAILANGTSYTGHVMGDPNWAG